MPLYYFHVRGGLTETEAEEGLEFPDHKTARDAAIEGARSLMAADVMEGRLDLDARIDVTGEGGELAFSVPFPLAAGLG
jgi:hypothetical protein